MAEINKPDMSIIWASSGDTLKPSDSKLAQGWQVEIPPRQWFNYIDNRQDQAIAYLFQHGIPVWDASTEYQEGQSYVQGSNGSLYKCVLTNTGNDPVSDTSNTYWTALVATDVAVNAGTTDDSFVTPKKLKLGFRVSLGLNGYLGLPSWLGGVIFQWGSCGTAPANGVSNFSYNIPFPTALLTIIPTYFVGETDSTGLIRYGDIVGATRTGATLRNGVNSVSTFKYFAIGY